jgi:mono/diheme cytochrome c family protein
MAVGALCYRVAAAAGPAENEGAAVYKVRCARCHGDSGKTDTSVGRVLKVAPLVDDPRLARKTPAEIAHLIMSDPKHRGVVDLDEDEVKAAAVFVKRLAAGR